MPTQSPPSLVPYGDYERIAAALQQNLFPQYRNIRQQLEQERQSLIDQSSSIEKRLDNIQVALKLLDDHPELERLLESLTRLNSTSQEATAQSFPWASGGGGIGGGLLGKKL